MSGEGPARADEPSGGERPARADERTGGERTTPGERAAGDARPSAAPAKPLPPLDDTQNGAFWRELARAGELRFQRCADCRFFRHPPRALCARCGSDRAGFEGVSGRGRVVSWTVTHQAFHPAFARDVPYAVVVTELEEGVRFVSGVRDLPLSELRLDLPVELVLEPAGEGRSLPQARPRRG